MQDSYNRVNKFISFMVILVLSFNLSKVVFAYLFELPFKADATGAPAAALFFIAMKGGLFIIFLSIMIFFMIFLLFILNYFIKKLDLFA